MSKCAIVLVSGGLDSTTCLGIAKDQGFDVVALSFDYGQRHSVGWRPLSGSSTTTRSATVTSFRCRSSKSSVDRPSRTRSTFPSTPRLTRCRRTSP